MIQRFVNRRETKQSKPSSDEVEASPVSKENVELPTLEQTKPTPAQRPAPQGTDAKTIIGKGIVVTGEITGTGDVDVRGTVAGKIVLPNNSATISRTGVAQASITAKNVEVAGKVEGDVVAQELVIIRKDSTIAGNVNSARVSLEDGAHFKGSIDMSGSAANAGGSESKRRPATPPPTGTGRTTPPGSAQSAPQGSAASNPAQRPATSPAPTKAST